MFFSRLRRRAKWMFLFLAVIFAGSFVFLGVGAGGSGVGDYLADIFGSGASGDTPSIEEARAKVEENPNDLEARRQLANALQADGQIAAAISELERYTEGRPQDADALINLAALYGTRAEQQRIDLAEAQQGASGADFAREITDPSSPLSESFSGPITELELQESSTQVNEIILEVTSTYSKQAATWESLTELQPDEPSNFLQLGQAHYLAGGTEDAIAAWKEFLELAPEDPNAPLIRRQVRALEQSTPADGQ
jgi:tetratricopeptide (TPR) repeat protein